jgi:hypothetical protein
MCVCGMGNLTSASRATAESSVSGAALGERVTVLRRGRKSCYVVRWTA